ncbi:MAG TPA: TetR/AcrR family transcriptional regulator [Caulobacteraceae bacterium]
MDQRRVRLSRAQQQALTRERLLAAAEKVIDRHGFGGASIDLISAEAGYSKGAIYSNFESKEAVFLELLRQYMERDMAALEQIVELEPDQLSAALTRWLETMDSETDCPLLVTELQLQARRNPAFAERYYALQAQQTRTLARILERYFEAASRPMPMDSQDLARALTALAHGLSLQRPGAAPGEPNPAGHAIDSLLKLLIQR